MVPPYIAFFLPGFWHICHDEVVRGLIRMLAIAFTAGLILPAFIIWAFCIRETYRRHTALLSDD